MTRFARVLCLAAALLAAAALVGAVRARRPRRPAPRKPPLPENPYHRFYTRPRRLEDLSNTWAVPAVCPQTAGAGFRAYFWERLPVPLPSRRPPKAGDIFRRLWYDN